MAQAGQGQYAAQLADAPPASSPAAATALAGRQGAGGSPLSVGRHRTGRLRLLGHDGSRLRGRRDPPAPHRGPSSTCPVRTSRWPTSNPATCCSGPSIPRTPATIHHTAIYAGNGLMVSADHTGDTVRLQPVWVGRLRRRDPVRNASQAATVGGPRWGRRHRRLTFGHADTPVGAMAAGAAPPTVNPWSGR